MIRIATDGPNYMVDKFTSLSTFQAVGCFTAPF